MRLIGTLICAAMLAGCSRQPARPAIPAIERFLDRLPPDIESIIVYEDSIGQEYLETGLFDLQNSDLTAPRIAELASWMPLVLLTSVGMQGEDLKDIWYPVFSGEILEYGVIAARKFRAPLWLGAAEGGGMIDYQGCGLVGLSAPLNEIPILDPDGANAKVIQGSQNRVFGGTEQDWIKHYVGRLDERTLLVCNDVDLFQGILGDAKDTPAPTVNLLRERRESSEAPVVGVRDFRMADPDDISSPRREQLYGGIEDLQAETFVLEAGAERTPAELSWYTPSAANVWDSLASNAGFEERPKVSKIWGGWRFAVTNPHDVNFGMNEGWDCLGFVWLLT